jgi:hypothetical protein
LGGRAAADTPFSGFAFPATGTTAPRTLPDRLAEIKNVKDFGATGNGVTDDWNAIQRAVNWTTRPGRGIIFFPPGNYVISRSVYFNGTNTNTDVTGWPYQNWDALKGGASGLSVIFQGSGNASRIINNSGDFAFQRNNPFPSAIRCAVRDFRIEGFGGVRLLGCVGGDVSGLSLSTFQGVDVAGTSTASVAGPGRTQRLNGSGDAYSMVVSNCQMVSGLGSGGYGVAVATGKVDGCTIQGYDHGIRLAGPGAVAVGNRTEVNNIGVMVGIDGYGNQLHTVGFKIDGLQTESCNLAGVEIFDGAGGVISGSVVTANLLPPNTCQRGVYLHGASFLTMMSTVVDGHYVTAALDANNLGGSTFISVLAANAGPGVAWLKPTDARNTYINTQ